MISAASAERAWSASPTVSADEVRAAAAASARSFANRHFDSLARHFHVSIASMAIRLRELGLVRA